MQKKKMVTSLLVAGAILASSFAGFLDVANADVNRQAVVEKPKVLPHVALAKALSAPEISEKQISVKETSEKSVSAQKTPNKITPTDTTSKKYVSASKTKTKKKVTKRKKRRSSTISRGGNSVTARKVVDFANDQLGKPYVWGASGPNAFDCSGFTYYVFKNFGISLPHNSTAQSNYGSTVSRSEISAGDLLFFATGGSKSINHVGIYIGNDQFIHGSSGKGKVSINDLSEYTKYAGVFITAKRIL